MALGIKSPKATKVKAVHVAFQSTVRKGDLLIELFDYEEKKILSEIDRAIEENAAKKAEVEGPFVANKLASLGSIVTARSVALTSSQACYKATQDMFNVGQVTLLEVVRQRQDVALRSYQALRSSVEQEIFRRNARDAATVYAQIDVLLRKEREYVEKSAARLGILAPRSGRLSCYVTVGTPVHRGYLLGEIN